MFPVVAIALLGYVLVYTAWKGQSVVDLALQREPSQKLKPPDQSIAATAGVGSGGFLSGVTGVDTVSQNFWSFPVVGHYTENRTDRGVDLETTPGSKLVAVGAGKIVNTNGAFPGGSIILKLDKAIGKYQYVFYGHLNGNKRVRTGQRVVAGQTLALSAQRPTGAESMPGHVEIGLVDNPAGQIESAHDNTHNTQSGNTFHTFLSLHFPGKVAMKPIIG